MAQVHFFSSTGSAYNACQCRDDIKTGDVLVVKDERVVGLAWAWPVAVTIAHGNFHTTAIDATIEGLKDFDKKPVFTPEQIELARAIAKGFSF